MLAVPCSLILSALALPAMASPGDRSADFQHCILRCDSVRCRTSQPEVLPLALHITRWTCMDDCKYICMHQITERDTRSGASVQQYYGKWPFWRFAGMQEPASVAFSLLNLLAHVRGAQKVVRKIPASHPMKNYYFAWSVVSWTAWIFSSIFHTRDLPVTEILDYFNAALGVLCALFYTVVRLFHLYPKPQNRRLTLSTTQRSTTLKLWAWAMTCILVYLMHVAYLSSLPRFDYSYNMAFNVILGLTHNILWLIYSLPASMSLIQRFPYRQKGYRPAFATKAAVFVALTTMAMSLELLDFPPWAYTIDAHALWHLATAPIAVMWYDFLIEDALDEGWRVPKA